MPQGYGDVHRLQPPEADSHGCGCFADPEGVAHLRDGGTNSAAISGPTVVRPYPGREKVTTRKPRSV